ncbi:MlaD family protein [Nocardia asteroides]|uniref:MlaD family protein n=1 Tax=Nocardia asteroides TaxID=1824 RepID=UPI001E4B5D39|nr:MlaD family protein [Nocardia asteroides]UGT62642.1 MlaD family protein [Nocardia asteroides]
MPFLKRGRDPQRKPDEHGTDLRWGITGLCLSALLVTGVGVVYVRGTDATRTYSADIAQAGSIREGDDVRLAGIPVGEVRSLTLLPDRVRMTFTVDDEVFVGDGTALGVRMLTVVGGYYLALEPAGSEPLGDRVIPRERVLLPYNLTAVFEAAIAPVRAVDGGLLRQNLATLAGSIDGSPEAVRSAVRAVGDLVGIMDQQNADISRALTVADEYLTALNGSSDVLVQLVNNLGTLESIVTTYKTEIAQALNDLTAVLHGLSPLGRMWDETWAAQARSLTEAMPKLDQLGGRMGELLDALHALSDRLRPLLPPGGGVALDHSGVCVPVRGAGC